MTTLTAERLTADQFEALPDGGVPYELVHGCLVERNVSTDSSEIASEFHFRLRAFLRLAPLGRVFDAELGYQVFPPVEPTDPERVRRADVSFVRTERLPAGDQGRLHIAPDLAIEVVSLHDGAADVVAKAHEWLAAGTPLVWVAYPATREIHVYRASGHHEILAADQEISGEDVLPGFHLPVRDCFPARPEPAPAPESGPASA